MYNGVMDTLQLDDLNPDPRNPRNINDVDFENLKALLDKYGDLSGIVRNRRTNQLVGGHQRVERFRANGENAAIQITQRYDEPTKRGTVALGYVVIDGEPFTYREVDWDIALQRAANIAANRAGGEWNKDLLTENVFELRGLENGDELLGLIGMHDDEIYKLLGEVGPDEKPVNDDESHMTFRLTESQYEIINQALMTIATQHDLGQLPSKDRDGNALYIMAMEYLDRNQNDNATPAATTNASPAGSLDPASPETVPTFD
jgi:hypothetical protein